jgi:cytochrome c-type biogenesis protein CcmH
MSSRWSQLKRWPGWVALGIVVAALLAVGVAGGGGAPTAEERIETISKQLACPICDGESVFESRNNASSALRAEIRDQVEAGLATDDQILTYIQDRYGDDVLLVPRSTGVDALVWILPVFALVCAAAGLTVAFRRWKAAADTVPTDDDRELVAAAREASVDEP